MVISSQLNKDRVHNPKQANLFRQSKRQVIIGFVLSLMFAVCLMFLDIHYQSFHVIRGTCRLFVAPLQYAVDYPVRLFDWVSALIQSRKKLVDDNIQLRYQQTVLESKMQQLLSIQEENSHLKQLLLTSSNARVKTMAAQILAVDANLARQFVILNKGKRDGVFVGQPVLDAKGVMGQIIDVGYLTSTVLLISDPKCAVPIRNNRTGERGILVGTQDTEALSVINLPSTSDIAAGDLLVTSGLGRLYPEGYPVGRVKSVTRTPGDEFIKVLVSPIAMLTRNRLVLLVWPDKQERMMTYQIEKRIDKMRKLI